MLRATLTALALILSAGPVAADDLSDVISQQLDAFAARDVGQAFSFASPMIQGTFGTPENFGAMVAQGFPMIWTPVDPRFGDRRALGPRTYQRVLLKDGDGVIRVMEYEMIQMNDAWLINGVREVPAQELAV